ncbi:MAG: alpha-1,2-fucosyltransferase [Caulobacteraceae bacterium]|nr:alpha-1,2-fucosyltransferase [Caulobacteraceae bacterium]
MITFFQLGKYGAIGNQLFQYATLYSIGKINNYTIKIPKTEEHFDEGTNRIQHYFLNCFDNIFAEILTEEDKKLIKYKAHDENAISYNQNMFNIPDFTTLEGYFQSYKYFIGFEQDLKKQFQFKKSIINSINAKYNINYKNFSSVHLRYGDYAHRQNYHPIMDKDYYKKAFELLDSSNYLVFSDSIEYAKVIFNDFKNINFIFVENNHAFEDMYLMSVCKDNILANSSFSWWAAWLNENNKVIAPKNWLGPAYYGRWNIEDLIPKEWIII